MSTGTAYFHSNLSAMYAPITSSEAMIAMIALSAMDWPNVGPIVVTLALPGWTLNWDFSLFVTAALWAGVKVFVAIEKPFVPRSVLDSVWIVAWPALTPSRPS